LVKVIVWLQLFMVWKMKIAESDLKIKSLDNKKKQQMVVSVFNKKNSHLFIAMVSMVLLAIQSVFAQQLPNTPHDSVKTNINDSLLPNLVIKVASYTAKIDHIDFLVRHQYNITPIALGLPEIEKKVKGFKTRLEKRGSKMNFRSLNNGMIMLNEIKDNLASYQSVLINYKIELTQSNEDVKKMIRDPALNVEVSDSVLMQQLDDLNFEGPWLDSVQHKSLARLNSLKNRVSISLLETNDIISDMHYLNISLKMNMWGQQEPYLFGMKRNEYQHGLTELYSLALKQSKRIISIYLNENWNMLLIGLLVFILIFSWSALNVKRIKKQENVEVVLNPVYFLRRNVLIGCLMALFTYLPFFFLNPPMTFMHVCELLRLLALIYLIYPYLTRQAKIIMLLISILWLYFAMDDLLLEIALSERWGLLFAGIVLVVVCVKIIISKKANFISLTESPATKALVFFTLILILFSIIFNLIGRVSLAKILGVSAIQCLVLGISLKVFCTMVLESIYLQSEAYHDSRFSDFINFSALKHRFLRILWILSTIIWSVSLLRDLTLYDVLIQALDSFFNEIRIIGNMVFTFKSVAVFISIIWLSSVISSFINFFFGNERLNNLGKRSRIGSMMLLIRLMIWTLGFGIAVAAAGIPLDKLSIMLGALGIGIGFGLQNIVNNLVSGIVLAFERPIQVGDLIEVGGKTGVVKEIGVRSSKINNNEGADIIVPNGDLLSQHLINWTMHNRHKQIDFIIGIPYQTDIKKIKTIITEVLKKNENIMQSPDPAILVQQFGDWVINLKILFWVSDLSYAGGIRSNAMIDIYEALTIAGIKLPVNRDLPGSINKENILGEGI